MIHDILAFTEDGSILYSWQSALSKIVPTNKSLLSGFFNSINTVLSEVFKGKLQKVILEDRVLCMTGNLVKSSENLTNSHWILVSVTVDKHDNTILVKNIINKILDNILRTFELKEAEVTREDSLNNYFNSFLNKNIYTRTKNKLLVSAILIFICVSISDFISTLNVTQVFEFHLSGDLVFLIGIIIGFILVIPSAAIAGTKKDSTIISIFSSFLATSFSYILIEIVIHNQIIGGVGTPIVFFGLSMIEGISCGIIGGTLIDRFFLYK